MKNYPFKRPTLLAGRLIGSSRGEFALERRSVLPLSFSLTLFSKPLRDYWRWFVRSSRKRGAMRS